MMPIGVVIAKRIIRVTGRRENSPPPPRLGLGLGLSSVSVLGREDIRIPRERPSKSWWNIMAVTSDAVGLGQRDEGRKGGWGRTEFRSGCDSKC